MKHVPIIGLKLALICAVAAVTLSVINAYTAPRIEANREQRILEALQQVSGEYSIGEIQEADHERIAFYYPLLDESGSVSGYILRIRENGYGGEMQIIAGYHIDGEIITARLLENEETPGLGKAAEDPAYMEKFEHTGGDSGKIPMRKSDLNSTEAEAISGATITFSSIAKALDTGSQFVQQLGRDT